MRLYQIVCIAGDVEVEVCRIKQKRFQSRKSGGKIKSVDEKKVDFSVTRFLDNTFEEIEKAGKQARAHNKKHSDVKKNPRPEMGGQKRSPERLLNEALQEVGVIGDHVSLGKVDGHSRPYYKDIAEKIIIMGLPFAALRLVAVAANHESPSRDRDNVCIHLLNRGLGMPAQRVESFNVNEAWKEWLARIAQHRERLESGTVVEGLPERDLLPAEVPTE